MEKELQVNGFKLHAVYNDEFINQQIKPLIVSWQQQAATQQRRIIVFLLRRREPASQHWLYSLKACAMIFRH